MEEKDKLTPIELDKVLALYGSLVTIVTFFAGFVFVTIPLVIFSAEVSPMYGRLILYFLLASLVIFTVMIDLYHSMIMRVFRQSAPNAFRILANSKRGGIADLLMMPAQFCAFSSISFMLLLKGQEFTIEAIIWFIVTIGRMILSGYIIFRAGKTTK